MAAPTRRHQERESYPRRYLCLTAASATQQQPVDGMASRQSLAVL